MNTPEELSPEDLFSESSEGVEKASAAGRLQTLRLSKDVTELTVRILPAPAAFKPAPFSPYYFDRANRRVVPWLVEAEVHQLFYTKNGKSYPLKLVNPESPIWENKKITGYRNESPLAAKYREIEGELKFLQQVKPRSEEQQERFDYLSAIANQCRPRKVFLMRAVTQDNKPVLLEVSQIVVNKLLGSSKEPDPLIPRIRKLAQEERMAIRSDNPDLTDEELRAMCTWPADPLSVKDGVFFVIKRTGDGTVFGTTYSVDVLQTDKEVYEGRVKKRVKVPMRGGLSPDVLRLAINAFPEDLSELLPPRANIDDLQRILDSGLDYKVIEMVADAAYRSRTGSTVQENEEAPKPNRSVPPNRATTKPVPPSAPKSAPVRDTAPTYGDDDNFDEDLPF